MRALTTGLSAIIDSGLIGPCAAGLGVHPSASGAIHLTATAKAATPPALPILLQVPPKWILALRGVGQTLFECGHFLLQGGHVLGVFPLSYLCGR